MGVQKKRTRPKNAWDVDRPALEIAAVEEHIAGEALWYSLDDTDRLIIRMLCKKKTQEQIGELVGITQQSVLVRTKKHAFQKAYRWYVALGQVDRDDIVRELMMIVEKSDSKTKITALAEISKLKGLYAPTKSQNQKLSITATLEDAIKLTQNVEKKFDLSYNPTSGAIVDTDWGPLNADEEEPDEVAADLLRGLPKDDGKQSYDRDVEDAFRDEQEAQIPPRIRDGAADDGEELEHKRSDS